MNMESGRTGFGHLSQRERSDRIERCDPGEGLRPIERPYPLTPTLSPWERGRTFGAATVELLLCKKYLHSGHVLK